MNEKKRQVGEIHAELVVCLTAEDVEDIVVTALEGGIGYWACLDNTSDLFEDAPEDEPVSITAANILLNGGSLCFYDQEDDFRTIEMNLDDLEQGIRQWIESGYDQYGVINGGKIDCCQIDALVADAIFQFALLGEIVYG